MSIEPGHRVGNYHIDRHVGSGAFATVWLARDVKLDAPVAVKVLADNWARDPEIHERFIDEAKLMRRIDDDRVVRVFTVDELPDGRPFFVMEFADRGTLQDRIAARSIGEPWIVAEAVAVTVETLNCLQVVHDIGVVHRDVKPSNILFRSEPERVARRSGRDERTVLGDFGLAKDLVRASGFTMAAGTPAYMAPEQTRSSTQLDHRADLFAVSAILFELLTGRPPAEPDSVSERRRAGSWSPELMLADEGHRVPGPLVDLLSRGLAEDPGRRFSSAQEMVDHLAPLGRAGEGYGSAAAADRDDRRWGPPRERQRAVPVVAARRDAAGSLDPVGDPSPADTMVHVPEGAGNRAEPVSRTRRVGRVVQRGWSSQEPRTRTRWRVAVSLLSAATVVAGVLAVVAVTDRGNGEESLFGSAVPGVGDPTLVMDEVVDNGDAWLRVDMMGGLAKIDMESREVVANVPVNGADSNLVTSPSRPLVTDDTVWIAVRDRQDGPTVYLIDRESARIRHRITLGVDGAELVPVNVVRAHGGAWATFAARGGEAVAVRLDDEGAVLATVELTLTASATPVSDGAHLFAVSADGAVMRVEADGSVDELELDSEAGAVALGDGVVYAFRSTAVDHIDPVTMAVEETVTFTADGRPFELATADGIPQLAAIAVSGTTVAFSTFDSGAIVNVVSLDADDGRVATRDELPLGGASESVLGAGSVSDVGPDGELWVNVQQSVVRIEDGRSEVIGIENPIRGAATVQDMTVVAAGVARIDTDDQGFPVATIFQRDEREVADRLPMTSRTITPLFEGGRFWLFGAVRGPVAPVDIDIRAVNGEPLEIDGISSGPMEVAGEVWVVTFATNDPHDPDDNERELLVLDPDDGTVVERRPFEHEGAVITDGDDVWVSGSDFVKIDPATGDELARVPSSGYQVTPIGYAFGMGIPDDIGHGAIWNLTASGVRRIDTDSLDVDETSIPGQPFSVTVAGDWAWVTTVEGGLYRLDPATGDIAGSVDVGDELIEIAVAGSTPFAVEIDGGHIHRIEVSANGDDRVAAVADVGFGPVTWREHQGFLWVANEATGRLHQIDQKGEIVKTLLLDGRPAAIASDGDSSLLVGLQDYRAVSLIDVGTRGELARIPLQDQ